MRASRCILSEGCDRGSLSGRARTRRRDGFEHSLEACVAVLQRADDAEGSIRDTVGRVFHGLWFASGA